MSLAVEIVDCFEAEYDTLYGAYDTPSPTKLINIKNTYDSAYRYNPIHRLKELSQTHEGQASMNAGILKTRNRNDSACELLDNRPQVAILTTASMPQDIIDAMKNDNKLGVFRVYSHGIESIDHGSCTPETSHESEEEFDFASADYFIVAVATVVFLDRTYDASELEHTLDIVEKNAKPGATVVIESIVPVGTTRRLLEPLMRSKGLKGGISPRYPASDDYFSHRPSISTNSPAKLIAGLDDITSGSLASIRALYLNAYRNLLPVSRPEIAELATLYDAGERMIVTSYANDMGDMCAPVGIDPFEVCAELTSYASSSSSGAVSPLSTSSAGTSYFTPALATLTTPGMRDRLVRLMSGVR